MKHTISVLVENRAGVLSRVSGLFSRRAFNIDSLAVGVTEDKSLSRMTIVAEGDNNTIEQLEKQLNKMVDVIKVRSLPQGELVSRELIMAKVSARQNDRVNIVNICDIMGAKIVDLSLETMTIELSDTPERVSLLEELLKPFGIREVVRTGTIALQAGASSI